MQQVHREASSLAHIRTHARREKKSTSGGEVFCRVIQDAIFTSRAGLAEPFYCAPDCAGCTCVYRLIAADRDDFDWSKGRALRLLFSIGFEVIRRVRRFGEVGVRLEMVYFIGLEDSVMGAGMRRFEAVDATLLIEIIVHSSLGI